MRKHCLNPSACTAAKPTTHCRKCATKAINTDPEIAERRRQAIRAKHAEPEFRKAHAERATRNISVCHQRADWLREQGRKLHRHSQTPEALAARRAVSAEAGKKRSNTVLAWCPPGYRDEYRFLIHRKRLPAAEARAIILAQVKHDSDPIRILDRHYGGKPARRRSGEAA